MRDKIENFRALWDNCWGNGTIMTSEDVEEIKSEIVRREAIIKKRTANYGSGTEK